MAALHVLFWSLFAELSQKPQNILESQGVGPRWGAVVWKGVTLWVGAVRGPSANRGRDAGVVVNDALRGTWR